MIENRIVFHTECERAFCVYVDSDQQIVFDFEYDPHVNIILTPNDAEVLAGEIISLITTLKNTPISDAE